MVPVQQVAEVLGGRPVLGRRVTSILDLSELVSGGLPKLALRHATQRLFDNPSHRRKLIYRIVPEATFKRRRDRLSPAESERTERLARVIATAEYVWQNRDLSRRFLEAPHPALRRKTPVEAALTELGARQVEELLARILHGLPA